MVLSCHEDAENQILEMATVLLTADSSFQPHNWGFKLKKKKINTREGTKILIWFVLETILSTHYEQELTTEQAPSEVGNKVRLS